MLTINKLITQGAGLAPVLVKRAATLELDWDVRQKSRFDATDSSGRALGVFLPRGTVARGGDVLIAEDGSLVRVIAAPQPVLVVRHCSDHGSAFDLLRAAYHLGNRHVPLELQPDHLKLEPDHVLADLLRQRHLIVSEEALPFEPEGGAYVAGPHDHAHGHDHAHHAHDHGHDHDHGHATENRGQHWCAAGRSTQAAKIPLRSTPNEGNPMRQLTSDGQQLIADVARRHGFSVDATMSMLESVINGNGSMAQFSHPEFAGSGQWMRGGMTMVSDMFNNALKGRVDSLCSELSNLIANQPDLVRSGSFQSQSQGNGSPQYTQRQESNSNNYHDNSRNSDSGKPSLFEAPAPGTSGDWWPSDLRWPNSTGAQNGIRYAYFAQARRLAIDVGGNVTVYDTLDHQIGGFSQQQSGTGTLSFSSQYGLIDVASLPVISGNNAPAYQAPQASTSWAPSTNSSSSSSSGSSDVFATIERLADLRSKGIISDDEFATKKAELLSRV